MSIEPLLHIRIPGPPVGAARPRVVRNKKTGASLTFMPDNAVAWEGHALGIAQKAWSGQPASQDALSIHVIAVHPRPQRLCRPKHPRGRIAAACKPDGDNVLKLTQDALVKAEVMVDDTRVVEARVVKFYQALEPAEQPHVEIYLWRYLGPSDVAPSRSRR